MGVAFPDFAPGAVWLVGAGPGDPGLLTLTAAHALERADVVLYDALVGDEVLALCGAHALLQPVGRRVGQPGPGQAEINRRLIEFARRGLRVVRLKCGDPFIFGRGGEELDELTRAGIEARVVPGVTAASGCAAAAGVPLTHRDHAGAVTFVTGRRQDGAPDLDWRGLAAGRQTLVFYMGVAGAGEIAEHLIAHGRSPATPVAVVENGTLPDQRVLTAPLSRLPDLIRTYGVAAPALIVVGEVAQFARADDIMARVQELTET